MKEDERQKILDALGLKLRYTDPQANLDHILEMFKYHRIRSERQIYELEAFAAAHGCPLRCLDALLDPHDKIDLEAIGLIAVLHDRFMKAKAAYPGSHRPLRMRSGGPMALKGELVIPDKYMSEDSSVAGILQKIYKEANHATRWHIDEGRSLILSPQFSEMMEVKTEPINFEE